MCANIWSPAAVEIQLAPLMRTYAKWAWYLGLFLFVVLRRLKASFQVYSMYSCQSLTLQQLLTKAFIYLFKYLHILSNRQLWWGKPPVTITEKWNQSIHSSVRTVISPNIPFYNLNRATLSSCDFWGWARGCCYSRRRRQLGLFNYNTEGVALLSQILKLLS